MSGQVSAVELAAALASAERPHLLDVREPEEYAIAFLPGSTLVPLREIPPRWAELSAWRKHDVVVCCHHGVRSLNAIHFLREQGFTRLRNLKGGIDSWSREVDPKVPRY